MSNNEKEKVCNFKIITKYEVVVKSISQLEKTLNLSLTGLASSRFHTEI
jgi:hypothetical protein